MDEQEDHEEVEGEDEEGKASKKTKFPITMFISEGNRYNRIGELKSAMQKYNEALVQEPNNARALIGRAQCLMKQGHPAEARADAEAALKADPRCVEGKAIIGGTEYLSGDFETGFITFYRTHVVRPNNKDMKVGYQMCQRAIENTLFPDDEMLRFDRDDRRGLAGSEGLGKPAPMFREDARFLKSMLKDEAYQCVHPKCQELLDYINKRRAFWRFQRPDVQKKAKKEGDLVMVEEEEPPEMGEDEEEEEEVEEEVEEQEIVEVVLSKEESKRAKSVKVLEEEEVVERVESDYDLSPSPSSQGTCCPRLFRFCRKSKKKNPPKK